MGRRVCVSPVRPRRRRTSWSYDRSSNAGNAVTRSRLLRARCSIARDCPFGIGFRPPTWSPPTRQASLRCNGNGNSVSGATKQRGDSCRSCDEPWFDLSGTASPARWRSMRPMWVGSKSGAEGGGCATVPRRSWSVPSRSAARDPVESGSVSSRICPPPRWSDSSNNPWLPAVSCIPTAGAATAPSPTRAMTHRRETQGHAKNAVKLFPRVHRVFSNLKTWLAGTHHGVGEQHLQHYLNEYVFRFNRRRAPMAAFQSLLGLASQHQPTTYHMLYDGESTG